MNMDNQKSTVQDTPVTEKILKGHKNGMAVLVICIAVYVLAGAGAVLAGMELDKAETAPAIACMTVCMILLCLGWIPFLGLKVLRPQEALVLTLFGNYYGTIRDAAFIL
jgi:hypothetical protein